MVKMVDFETAEPEDNEVVEAFSPEDARKARTGGFPNEVIRLVNAMLAKSSLAYVNPVIYQDDVVDELVKLGYDRARIFADHLLDFEKLYEEKGWTVSYDKPGYSDSGKAYWVFTAPKS